MKISTSAILMLTLVLLLGLMTILTCPIENMDEERFQNSFKVGSEVEEDGNNLPHTRKYSLELIYDVNIISMFVIGILEMGLSIPLIFEKVPPNWIYGFRTRKTRHNENIWYQANKFAGKTMFLAGLITTASGAILMGYGSGLGSQMIEWISLLIIFTALFGSIIADFLFLRTL